MSGPDVPPAPLSGSSSLSPTSFLGPAQGVNLADANWKNIVQAMPSFSSPQVNPAQAVAYSPPPNPGVSPGFALPTTQNVAQVPAPPLEPPPSGPSAPKAPTAPKQDVAGAKASQKKFENFMSILQGVSNLASSAAAIKTAFTKPKTQASRILGGSSLGGLAPAPGVGLSELPQIQGTGFQPQFPNVQPIEAQTKQSGDLLALLRALGKG